MHVTLLRLPEVRPYNLQSDLCMHKSETANAYFIHVYMHDYWKNRCHIQSDVRCHRWRSSDICLLRTAKIWTNSANVYSDPNAEVNHQGPADDLGDRLEVHEHVGLVLTEKPGKLTADIKPLFSNVMQDNLPRESLLHRSCLV